MVYSLYRGMKRKASPIWMNKRIMTTAIRAATAAMNRTKSKRRVIAFKQRAPRYGIYRSKFTRKRRGYKNKAYKALMDNPTKIYRREVGGRENVANGKQLFDLVATAFDSQDMRNILSSEGSVVGSNNVFRFRVVSATYDFMLCNTTNNQIVVYLYCFQAKNNDTESVFVKATTGDNQLTAKDTSGVVQTENNIGYSPLSAPKVYRNYHKYSVKKKVMDPGSLWSYRIHHPIHKFFTTDSVPLTGNSYLKGISDNVLIRVHGTPASYATAEGTVTVSEARVDWTCVTTMKYKYLADSQLTHTLESALTTVAGDTRTINDETGAITVVDTTQ